MAGRCSRHGSIAVVAVAGLVVAACACLWCALRHPRGCHLMTPEDFNRQIIEEFRAHAGAAPSLGDMPLLLLHHVGAVTGRPHVAPLAFIDDGGDPILLASNGGRHSDPAWYRNLQARPEARVEFGAETIDVTAENVDGPERDALFERLLERVPSFKEYLEKSDRVMPVVRLRRQPPAKEEIDGDAHQL